MLYTLHKRNKSQCKFWRIDCLEQSSPNSCNFWNTKSVFHQTCITLSVSWDITLLHFFSWDFIYFQQKKPIQVQLWQNVTWAAKSMKFYTMMVSCSKNYIKIKVQKSYLSRHWRVMQSLKKNGLATSNMTWGIW